MSAIVFVIAALPLLLGTLTWWRTRRRRDATTMETYKRIVNAPREPPR